MLNVDNEVSDLDLLVSTFDCLFDRYTFYTKLEQELRLESEICHDVVIVRGANIPLAKF